jgi:hypothetical protein
VLGDRTWWLPRWLSFLPTGRTPEPVVEPFDGRQGDEGPYSGRPPVDTIAP